MAIEDFFDHKCDIYHLRQESKTPGYGLPSSLSFSYPEEPDCVGVECHFGVKNGTIVVTQSDPENLMDAKLKLTLPCGTDIRLNDKVIDCDTGLEYTAEQPRNIRSHHLFVFVKRTAQQRAL
jgi:hypothetical protein